MVGNLVLEWISYLPEALGSILKTTQAYSRLGKEPFYHAYVISLKIFQELAKDKSQGWEVAQSTEELRLRFHCLHCWSTSTTGWAGHIPHTSVQTVHKVKLMTFLKKKILLNDLQLSMAKSTCKNISKFYHCYYSLGATPSSVLKIMQCWDEKSGSHMQGICSPTESIPGPKRFTLSQTTH